jgi:kynurenine formamidase
MEFKQDGYKLIDVSHVVRDGMMTYKGLPVPIICDYLNREASKAHYEEDTSFQIGVITMCSNTGTYVDVPFHRFEKGKDLSEIELSKLANLEALKIIIPDTITQIGKEYFEGLDLKNKALLVQTGWSRHWNTDQYFEGHPFITEEAALYLKQAGLIFIGIDTYNIDDLSQKTRPCHSIFLGADIPICEHMTNLSALPDAGFKFFAVPVKVKGMGTFPVRAFGLIET